MSNEMNDQDRTTRNAIFATARAVEEAKNASAGNMPNYNGVPTISQGNKDMSIDLEVTDVPLPSQGLVYPSTFPLHNSQVVTIKQMTSKEEDILMNRTFVRRGTVITELIKSCLINRTIDPNDLISGDRNALMVAIRITGYDEKYVTDITCPKCDLKQKWNVDLSRMPIKELDLSKIEQVEPFSNLFKVTLPSTKKTVTFKFLTGADEERILQDMEAKKKKGVVQENLISTRLISTVVAVNGVETRDLVVRFCSNLPAKDSKFLRHHIDSNEPGISMVHEFTCSNSECDYSNHEFGVPITAGFFYPDKD